MERPFVNMMPRILIFLQINDNISETVVQDTDSSKGRLNGAISNDLEGHFCCLKPLTPVPCETWHEFLLTACCAVTLW